MTKLPIPDDWNGEDWRCVQVEWPNSPWWNALLVGLLSQPKRGRFWEENSGTVTDAQAIGQQIFLANFPFNLCNGAETTTEDREAVIMGGGMGCLEIEDVMPCIDISQMLDIVDGKLIALNGCCEWVEIGAIAGVSETVEDPYDPESDTYSACGKANAVIDVVYNVAQSIYDEIDNYPWEWSGHVKADNQNVQLSANYIAVAVVAGIEISILQDNAELWFGPQIFDQTTKQSLLCALTLKLDDTPEVPSNFRTILEELFNGEWSINLLAQSFWFQVFAAIGSGDLANVATLGATDLTQDCDCPGPGSEQTNPSSNGWYLSAERTVNIAGVGGFDYGHGSLLETVQHDIYGIIWRTEYISGDAINVVKRGNDAVPAAGWDNYMHGSNSDNFGSDEEWKCQVGDAAFADIDGSLPEAFTQEKDFDFSDTVITPVNAKGDIVLSTIDVQATGDPASNVVKCTWRWLYNTGSASHS